MVKRIAVSPTQFKISRPGVDVDAATAAQLAFDGFGLRYNGVYMTGATATNDGSWTVYETGSYFFGQTPYTRLRKVISLGKTFTTPPQVIYALLNPADTANGMTPRYSYIAGGSGAVAWASTTTTDLLLRLDYPSPNPVYGPGPAITTWNFAYVVFQAGG